MSTTKIDWTDFTLNPVKGKCPMACEYCYAIKMYDRFGWNPKIRFELSVFNTLPKKPCRVFVGSTMELFLFDDWMECILNRCQDFPDHTFQFLTKKPEKLPMWSPFPGNCHVGVTATDYESFYFGAIKYLPQMKAKVKYISFEPLLEGLGTHIPGWLSACLIDAGINWVIIGAQTNPYKPPQLAWVEEIIGACCKANIPYFLKDNLGDIIPGHTKGDKLRQELPIVKS